MRQAFELAIDREALIQVVYNGMYAADGAGDAAELARCIVPGVKPPPRDVAKAKALLKQAGVKLPVTVNLMVPNNPDLRQIAEVIQSMAAEAGFDVQITAIGIRLVAGCGRARGEYEAFLTAGPAGSIRTATSTRFLHTGRGAERRPLLQPDGGQGCWTRRARVDRRRAAAGDLRARCVAA